MLALVIDKTSSPEFYKPQFVKNQATSYGHYPIPVKTHANKNHCQIYKVLS
jgi:hypothetical protein